MQKPKDDRAVGATRLFWSDHECASVEKIMRPVEQREISFPHDIIRRSVTDILYSLESILTSICDIQKVPKWATSCYPKSEWLLLIIIMAHYFAGILTYDSCCWIAVSRV